MTDLITETYAFGNSDLEVVEWDNEQRIRDLLLGHRVTKIWAGDEDHLELDDGTLIRVVPNEGCGGCGNGYYELRHLTSSDNIITHVDLYADDNDQHGEDHTYRVFIVTEDTRFNLFTVDGTDGNGYYGTGYHLVVRAPS